MNEKTTIQDLVLALVQCHEMEKEHAEAFVQTFFELIEEGLTIDRYVKVKGWGTFKLIQVESRESVDVKTGERIEIPAYHRITFTPDVSLRELINKPFAHFETVVLNDTTHFDDLKEDDNGNEEQDDILIDEAVGIEDESNDTQNSIASPVSVPTPTITESSVEKQRAQNETELVIPQEVQTVVDARIEVTQQQPEPAPEYQPLRKSNPWCMYATILFCGIILGGGVAWFIMSGRRYVLETDVKIPTASVEKNYPSAPSIVVNDSLSKKDSIRQEKKDTIQKDTLNIVSRVEKKILVEKHEIVKSKKETIADTVKYRIVGTQTNYTLKEGETLVKVSYKFFGDKKLWPYIAKHNDSVITNPDNIPVGTTIKIPKLVPNK